jgi:hypothetical protein
MYKARGVAVKSYNSIFPAIDVPKIENLRARGSIQKRNHFKLIVKADSIEQSGEVKQASCEKGVTRRRQAIHHPIITGLQQRREERRDEG